MLHESHVVPLPQVLGKLEWCTWVNKKEFSLATRESQGTNKIGLKSEDPKLLTNQLHSHVAVAYLPNQNFGMLDTRHAEFNNETVPHHTEISASCAPPIGRH
jgi:hypothetical protein